MSAAGVLLTGFGPFPGVPDNPSETVARRAAEQLGADFEALRTEYDACERWAERTLSPDLQLLLHIGVATDATRFRLERRAHNGCGGRHDAAQFQRRPGAIVPNGPETVDTPVDVPSLVADCCAGGLPVVESQDAGRYLCNFTYYRSLHHVHTAGWSTSVLFLHIPPFERAPIETQIEVVARIVSGHRRLSSAPLPGAV